MPKTTLRDLDEFAGACWPSAPLPATAALNSATRRPTLTGCSAAWPTTSAPPKPDDHHAGGASACRRACGRRPGRPDAAAGSGRFHWGSRGDEGGFVGEDHGLDAAVQAELEQDAGDVALDGGLLDEQAA